MIEFQVNGQTRGFKFGTYTFKLINELAGTKTVEDVFEGMKDGNVEFVSKFYYACAKHYALTKKIALDFEEVDVCDWIDDMGPDEVGRITNELMRIYTSKNVKAPAAGQVLQSSNGVH